MSGLGVALDPTRLAGTLAFGTAALACLRAAAASRRRPASLWWSLGALQLVCVLEVLLGLRYGLHETFNGLLQDRGWYASRGAWQGELLLAALGGVGTIVALACWRHRDDAAAIVAVVGTALGVSVLGTETISLHRIDAIMYAPAGPLVALAWMWIAAAALVTAAALSTRR